MRTELVPHRLTLAAAILLLSSLIAVSDVQAQKLALSPHSTFSSPEVTPLPVETPVEPTPSATPDNGDWYYEMWVGTRTPTPVPTPQPSPSPTSTPSPIPAPPPGSILSSCFLTGRVWNAPLPTPTSNGPFEQVEFGTPAQGLDGFINNTKCWLSNRDLLTGVDLAPFAVGGGVRTEGEVGMPLSDYDRYGVICVGIPSIGFYVTCDLEVLY